MPNYEKAQIIGHVGRSPELREVGNSQVASFSLAVSNKWTDKSTGEQRENTNWYTCSVWGKQADVIMRYVNKGDALFCEGTPTARAYIGKDGEARASLELKVFNFQFLGGRGDSNGQAEPDDMDSIPF